MAGAIHDHFPHYAQIAIAGIGGAQHKAVVQQPAWRLEEIYSGVVHRVTELVGGAGVEPATSPLYCSGRSSGLSYPPPHLVLANVSPNWTCVRW